MQLAGPGKVPLAPGAGLMQSPGPQLEAKVVSLCLLLALTLLCGLLPLCLLRQAARGGAGGSETRRRAVSLISCFAGGVFLATCLLDLLPDYLAGMADVLRKMQVELAFPLVEFIIAMGFFLVLIMEQMFLACKDLPGSSEETRGLLGWPAGGGFHHHGDGLPSGDPGLHLHVDLNSHSAIRSFVLVFSLSLHSVFEGLAVGLQEANAKVVEVCVALSIHKCIIAFSLTLKLLQSRLRRGAVVSCVVLFAVMSPLGIGLGILLTEDAGHQLVRSVLEGIATGTFVYITFMEILPHELSSSDHRIAKVLALITGFSVVTAVLFIKV